MMVAFRVKRWKNTKKRDANHVFVFFLMRPISSFLIQKSTHVWKRKLKPGEFIQRSSFIVLLILLSFAKEGCASWRSFNIMELIRKLNKKVKTGPKPLPRGVSCKNTRKKYLIGTYFLVLERVT
jgi:hypothetical protein